MSRNTLAFQLSKITDAFGQGDTIRVYTEQQIGIATRLLAGHSHLQPRLLSAPYDFEKPRGWRHAHKRAYAWMAFSFAQEIGRAIDQAPIWVSTNLTLLVENRSFYKERALDNQIIILDIPRSEILMSNYDPWTRYVLTGRCISNDFAHSLLLPGERCSCVGRLRRASWRAIFDLAPDPLQWQGILDRIDSAWLKGVLF